jgi:hypothetical protein
MIQKDVILQAEIKIKQTEEKRLSREKNEILFPQDVHILYRNKLNHFTADIIELLEFPLLKTEYYRQKTDYL